VQVALEISIAIDGLTVDELTASLPELGIRIAPALARATPTFDGRIEIDDDTAEATHVVARTLASLRSFSVDHPTAVITIASLPDGGVLRLEAGSFGDDDDELTALLAGVADEPTWCVYVSFRIGDDHHPHVRDLLERTVVGTTPVFEGSPNALAVGFELTGSAARLADLVGMLRIAWHEDATEIETLVEVEGPTPIVMLVRTWSEWVELERSLRRSGTTTTDVQASVAGELDAVVLAQLPGTVRDLGTNQLTWIDDDDQVMCLSSGQLFAITDRVELGTHGAEIRRRSGGGLFFATRDRTVDLPPDDDVERRLHAVSLAGVLFSDTSGRGDASSTRLRRLRGDQFEDGPSLSRVRAIEPADQTLFALADGRHGVALLAFELRDWGYAELRPWAEGEQATDLAAIGTTRLAVAVETEGRARLLLLERADLIHGRELALPCIAPQIVGCGRRTVWVTGMAPPPGPPRCDLFRVDLPTGRVIVETAELLAATLDVAIDDHPPTILPREAAVDHAVLASPHAVHVTTGDALRELVELGRDEEVTGFAIRDSSPAIPAVFVRGPAGARVILGQDRSSYPLPSAGHAPRLGR